MSDPIDPYAPPTANLEVEAPKTETLGVPFFATSVTKVWLYSLSSLSLYLLYWHYKQWSAYRAAKGRDISPFWRTFFSPFFVFELFPLMAAQANMQTNAVGLAAIYTAASVISNVASRLNDNVWVIGLIAILPVAIMQGGVNEYLAKAYPSADKNDRIGGGGVVLIIIGVIWWLLILAGMLLPDDPS